MLRITQIKIENFRSILHEQTIVDLPPNGLIGIDGPSGGGKSTVLLAIATLLDLSPFPGAKNQNLYTKKKLQVTGTLVDGNGTKYTVFRGKTNSVLKNGEVVAEGATGTSAYVKRLFSMSTDVLSAITYRPQGEPGTFTGVPPSGRQKFLSQVLGLAKYENALKAIRTDIKKTQDAIKSMQGVYDAQKKTIDTLPSLGERPIDTSASVTANVSLLENELEEALKLEADAIKRRDEYVEKRQEHDARRRTIQGEIDKLQQSIAQELKDAQTRASEKTAEIDSEIRKERANLDLIKSKHTSMLSVLKKEHETAISANRQLKFLSGVLPLKKADLSRVVKEIADLEIKMSSIGQGECPVCKQKWEHGADQEKKKIQNNITKLQKELVEFNKQIAEHESELAFANAAPQIEAVEQKIRELDGKVATALSSVEGRILDLDRRRSAVYQNENDEIAPKIHSIELKIRELLLQLQSDVTPNDSGIFAAVMSAKDNAAKVSLKLEKLRQERNYSLAKYQSEIAMWQERSAWFANQQTLLNERHEQIQSDIKKTLTLDAAATVLKTFLTGITEDVLNDVANEANLILASLRNTNSVTVGFPMSETVSENGAVTYDIDMTIEKNGVPFDLKANLSGGQQTSIHLAVDLALLKILTQRQGTDLPGFLMLDEAFEGHSTAVKEDCMEILSQMAVDKQVFIIDHSSEFKDYYRKKIVVKCNDGYTELVTE